MKSTLNTEVENLINRFGQMGGKAYVYYIVYYSKLFKSSNYFRGSKRKLFPFWMFKLLVT